MFFIHDIFWADEYFSSYSYFIYHVGTTMPKKALTTFDLKEN